MARRLFTLAAAAATAGFALATYQAARRAERERPAPGRFITVRGVRLHYLDRGAGGTPMVLLHGNGAMVEDWISSGLLDRLARDRRVVAFDRPGFGRSERPQGTAGTPEREAELIVEAMRRLGLPRAVVLGHSYGSLVTLALTLDHPEAVAGLGLMGGFHFPVPRVDVLAFSPGALPVIGAVLRYTVSPHLARLIAGPLIRRMFAPLPVPRRFAREFPLPLALRPWQIRASAEDSAAMIPAAARLSARLGELSVPVAIIAGERDELVTPARHAVRLHREIVDSRLTLVPGAGHMVHHAAPETVAEEMERLAA